MHRTRTGVAALLFAAAASAQWTTAGNNIHNSNTANVGIGTTAPTEKLHVFSPSSRFGDGGSFNLNFTVPNSSSVAARFFTGGAERLTILGSGQVGIGTTAPATPFHVRGTGVVEMLQSTSGIAYLAAGNVTSGKTGVAMKSAGIDVAGVTMHRPGTVIGKALEPLASGEGEILVLLSLQ
jgi:hypothetical protein